MNTDRLTQLLEFYNEDNTEPFNIYCLANEYKNHEPKKALIYYQELLDKHADYLPTYYHTAELLLSLDDLANATRIIEQGIALAIKQNDQLALRELKNMQMNMIDY